MMSKTAKERLAEWGSLRQLKSDLLVPDRNFKLFRHDVPIDNQVVVVKPFFVSLTLVCRFQTVVLHIRPAIVR